MGIPIGASAKNIRSIRSTLSISLYKYIIPVQRNPSTQKNSQTIKSKWIKVWTIAV